MRFLFLFLIVPLFSSGQYAIVRGVAPLGIGKEIQLKVIEDPVTNTERILAQSAIDVDGSFELKVIPNGTRYAFIQVGQDCADFFIERDKTIELTFVPPKKDSKKPQAFREMHFFTPKIIGGESAKLNQDILSFNDSLDTFLEALYPTLVNRKSPDIVSKELSVFEDNINIQFGSADPFVKDYIKYSVAGIEQTFLTDRKRLFDKYLKNVKPKFNNPAYSSFLLQFYQGEVYKMAVVNQHEEVKRLLAGNEAFAKMDEMLLAAVPELTDVSVRRMVLVAGIDGLFGQKDFEDADLIRALRSFSGLTSNSVLGATAKNVAAKYETMTNGTIAPEIVFTDIEGTEKRLSDFQGKYVFLELTDANNGYANRETNVIPNLKNEFRFVEFVTIGIGNSQQEMVDLQKKFNIDWNLGLIALSSSTLDDYRVKSLPLFFIIDPDGKFYRVPAMDPTKGAQQELMSLNEKLKAKNRGSVGK